MTTRLTPENFASRYSLDRQLVLKAYENLDSGKALAVGVSGKLGAGKDTAAPLIMAGLGYANSSHEFFAKALKDEVDLLIEAILAHDTIDAAAKATVERQSILLADALLVVERIWEEVKSGQVTNSRVRTKNTRFVLQHWGTEIRRTQDVDYWVKKSISVVVERLAEGISVYATDARFENEVDSLHALGASTIRLKVSPEEQSRRILARDGILPSEEARNHVSETALDRYEEEGNFTLVLDTDSMSILEVVEVSVKRLRERELLSV